MQNLYIAVAIVLVWGGSLLFAQHVDTLHLDQAHLDAKTQNGPGRTESHPIPEDRTSSEQWQSGSPTHGFSFPVRMVESPDKEQRREEKEWRSEQREEEDLRAQRNMAKTAKKAIAPAWWQVGISLFGAILLGASLIYSARAASASAIAAKAAEDVLKADRAWISLVRMDRNFHTNPVVSGVKYPDGIGFFTVWINSGRSPALQVGVWVDVRVVRREDPVPHFEKEPIDENSIVGQGITITTREIPVVGDDLSNLIEMKSFAYLYTYVRYRDVFGEIIRDSELCLRIFFQGYFDDGKGGQLPRFGAVPVGPQNRAS